MLNHVQAAQAERDLKTVLASYAHNAWAGWMKYMFFKSQANKDGTVTIPVELVERWKRQMNTIYKDLPETEKISDIEEARKMISIMHGFGF